MSFNAPKDLQDGVMVHQILVVISIDGFLQEC